MPGRVVLPLLGAALVALALPAARPPLLSSPNAEAGEDVAAEPGDSIGCGGRSKKTLTDAGAGQVDLTPQPATVDALRSLPRPENAGAGHPRVAAERTTFRVHVQMLYARLERDRDIHLVVADGPGQPSMIVELPDATCPVAAQSAQAPAMAAARLALLQAVPVTATGSPLAGRAELSGVGFFDEVHGQFGVAPNGFELHPVLSFRLESPPPRLRLLSWRIRRVGHYLAERASLELCTLRPGGYRLGLNVQAQGRLHRFSGRFHQPRNERCSRTDVSFRLPAAARRQQLQATVTISGGRRLTVAAGRRLAAG